MQYWLYLCKIAKQLVVFALVSLVLSACTTPHQPQAINTLKKATPIVANQGAAASASSSDDERDYYDTTGTVASQEDIDELLGVTDMEAVVLSPEDLAKFGDVWERVRAGFKLNNVDNERIAAQRIWFTKRQDYINRMTARASHYLYHTVTEAEKAGVPTELALLPVIESSYDPFATSPAQAAGMWQFIPGTGKIFGLRQTWWYDGRRDVLESTRAAYKFLTQLYNKFGSWELALAAYNWGPGNVQRAIDKNTAAGLPTDYWSLTMPAETMAYVPRFLAVAQIVKNPAAFNVSLKPIVNQPHFRETYAKNQVDLSAAAKLAGITTKELYQLNPGYMRWATNPDGPHRLLVPINTIETFEEQLASLPPPERYVTVQKRYKVKKGDTLYRIAAKFDTTPAALKRLNGALVGKKGRVPVGKMLVISKVRTLVGGETVDTDQLVNPAAERVAMLEKAEKQEAQKEKENAKDDKKLANKKDKSDDNDSKSFHKVRAGDTLYSIAKKYDVTVKELADWNNLKVKNGLKTGKKLVIFQNDHDDTRVAKAEKKSKKDKDIADDKTSRKEKRLAKEKRSKKEKDSVKRISYEVKRGDTLYSISQRYNVSVSQIKTWNKASKHIKPGQDLVLYLAKG
ncbi:membrane-bound lytic murein transglycosylase D [Agitococcus lubricus]|uniref:Membrane-bound lytic murein transglycosylase D n=1 Tax=Agitococcus lubricus TaxID=1077255 RepID=A0A2T5J1L6_9GAMM|nr:LysM peptidoglycan-binding domain-containing protein [Agitococcus lubricus]PTQ90335.1 membrane-bound lytic murein transglycosylase D [Agitococcus lubricus]